jgi:hypothetical protein
MKQKEKKHPKTSPDHSAKNGSNSKDSRKVDGARAEFSRKYEIIRKKLVVDPLEFVRQSDDFVILDQQYPDQYIALFGKALAGYLVIAHDPSLKKLNDYLGRLPPQEREKIIIHFTGECAPNTLEVHFDLPTPK